MPGIERLFADIAEITKVNGRTITNDMLKHTDALLCRSITPVNQSLLQGTQVNFVGTATIGTDHIDIPWLISNGISWSNAAGCNAAAVAQYVLSATSYWCFKKNKRLQNLTIGIVGAGNVGSELARCLDVLKIKYLLCDPPLQSSGDIRSFSPFSKVLSCDVLTLHVPLVKHGKYPTYHMLGSQQLAQLKGEKLLINASRGAVINNQTLAEFLNFTSSTQAVIDVFENEPNISPQLMSECLLATPHIAGHTLEGKLRGSWLIYQAFCQSFNLPVTKQESVLYPNNSAFQSNASDLEQQLLQLYNIKLDSDGLRELKQDEIAAQFDSLRKNATQLSDGTTRRDYSGWNLPTGLTALGEV